MAENIIQLSVNTDTRRAVQATTLNQPKANEVIRLIYGERPIIGATFVNTDGTAIAFGVGDTFEMNIDVDFTHDSYAGTTNAAYSGAVTSIAITFAEDMTGKIRDTGSITLQDTSNPSNRESVDYTAIAISGGSNEVVTFTVSKTLVNSYASGDYGAVQDRLMAQATEDDVNTGEWTSADKTAGKVSFRLDCRDVTFSEKLTSLGTNLEYQINMEIKRYPSGSTIPIVLLQDKVYGRQTVRDLEEVTIPSDENWTAADARYFKTAGVSGGQTAYGGTGSGDDLILDSTSNATKGDIQLQPNGGNVLIGATSPAGSGNLSVGRSSALVKFNVEREATSDVIWNGAAFIARKTTAMGDGFGTGFRFYIKDDVEGVDNGIAQISAYRNGANNTGAFQVSTAITGSLAERFRVTGTYSYFSTPLLIGATSPVGSELLHVAGDAYVNGGLTVTTATPIFAITATSGDAYCQVTSSPTGQSHLYLGDTDNALIGQIIYDQTSNYMAFNTAAAEAMRIDSSGNVGIGVTPETWSVFKCIQTPSGAYAGGDFGGGNLQTNVYHNAYYDGSFKYIKDGFASVYEQSSGAHYFKVAGSGVADATMALSTAMTIDTSGNVLIGTTAQYGSEKFAVNGDAYVNGSITSAGRILVDDTTQATTTTDGSLQTDGGLSVVKDAVIGGDVAVTGNLTRNYAMADAYVSTAGATASITAGTPVNLFANANLSAGDVAASNFTIDDTNKRLTYTGTNTKIVMIDAILSTIASASNVVVSGWIYKNGTKVASTEQTRKIGTGADVGNWSIKGMISMATNDYVEIFVDLASGTGTITANQARFSANEMG